MKKAVYYVFYRLFDMHSRGEDHLTGAFMAIFTISLLFWLNIFMVVGLLRKIDVIPIFFSKTAWISFMIFLFIIDYFIFVHHKKYEKIIKMFKDEPRNKKIKNGLLVLLYVLLSATVFMLGALYKPG